jgi:hypothetical protein
MNAVVMVVLPTLLDTPASTILGRVNHMPNYLSLTADVALFELQFVGAASFVLPPL